jgi:hypothetical protein
MHLDQANRDRGHLDEQLAAAQKRITQLDVVDRDARKLRQRLFAKSREIEWLRESLASLKGEVYQVRQDEDMAINFVRSYGPR